uniref:Uncharacterized protein n=1 Tax=Kwoniella bestiolae CBS 10118 TaxID=1296100 RepID=A0A1B9G292_9TREE|nr:hypothetical protein I302_04928 [Kwoniella bestiolae CBS 10118]OCF25118.1 hypothetical protein I302_04928 [Kwoniella bestiolae CBS 10118]
MFNFGSNGGTVQVEMAQLKAAPVLNPNYGMPGLPESSGRLPSKSRSHRSSTVVDGGTVVIDFLAEKNVSQNAINTSREKFDHIVCILLAQTD